jgi:hypothetical protein
MAELLNERVRVDLVSQELSDFSGVSLHYIKKTTYNYSATSATMLPHDSQDVGALTRRVGLDPGRRAPYKLSLSKES